MILVLLGTQDKSFYRLLKAVDDQIEIGNIKEKVIVQAGETKYFSKNMEIFDLIPMDKFDNLIKEADLIISHGGVGSIITALKNNKKVIACARLMKYKEHTNDHQLQIIDNFVKAGYIMEYKETDDLGKILNNVNKFEPKKYKSNTKKMIKLLEEYIENI